MCKSMTNNTRTIKKNSSFHAHRNTSDQLKLILAKRAKVCNSSPIVDAHKTEPEEVIRKGPDCEIITFIENIRKTWKSQSFSQLSQTSNIISGINKKHQSTSKTFLQVH